MRIPDGDKTILWGTAAAVTAVAGFAAVQSYTHIFGLALAHGQSRTDARLLPLSVDGLIVAASLVILFEARRKGDTPWTAWAMLGLGIAATLAANVLSGLPGGWLSAAVSAWPPVAFVGAVEIVMRMIRRTRPGPSRGSSSPAPGTVPSSVLAAAETSLRATVAAGNPWSVNQLVTQFSLPRGVATKLRTAVLAEANGNGTGHDPEAIPPDTVPAAT